MQKRRRKRGERDRERWGGRWRKRGGILRKRWKEMEKERERDGEGGSRYEDGEGGGEILKKPPPTGPTTRRYGERGRKR